MRMTRRQALGLAAAAPAILKGAPAKLPIAPGPFQGNRESLKTYKVPDWFRDAKFGIWAHWGPQSAAEYGDWYARNMYIEGNRQYNYHVKTYGHPSKFGFKDIIPTWKAEKFDPARLMSLYRKAGAKYFVSMGVHHDNFDLWNSKLNPWNAVKMGPKRDVVGEFRKAAQKEGLRFGVSEHLAVSYHWFQTSHGADKQGEFKGVPYDGADPKFAGLYHEAHEVPKAGPWSPENVPDAWKQRYFDRIKDLIDNYRPDLMYTDGPIFFGEYGEALMAHHYNTVAKNSGGRIEGVWANKGKDDCVRGTCLLDLERGVVDRIWDDPWQTDTCIGQWHYNKEAKYKSPKIVIDMLVDIVSRNGNLLLNFPLPNNGMLDPEELKILDEITKWMAVNSEAIYGTRPWKTHMDSGAPAEVAARAGANDHHQAGAFNERNRKELTASDIRFTQKNGAVYVFAMGRPEAQVKVPSLAPGGKYQVGRIANVEMLGAKGKLNWTQDENGLAIQSPPQTTDHAVVFKVIGA